MLNCVYRLIAPKTFEPVQVDFDTSNKVIVRPTYLSICHADQRYYQGTRSEEVMARKLPMALIHEGVGRVVSDDTGLFNKGERVVMLPNNPHETDEFIAENYLRSSEFCGSGFDGFMQESMVLDPQRLVSLPNGIEEQVAVITELVTVASHAISRFDTIAHGRRDRIGVWGDGNLGYLVALLLRMRYPSSKIVVFGLLDYKLDEFTFVDETWLTRDIDKVEPIDHAFECCGGEGSAPAIDQIIDIIRPEGTISLMGVSENPVPINTRMVLEKGLRMFGSSRSGRADFLQVIETYTQHPETLDYLSALVDQVHPVSSLSDVTEAFEADTHSPMGKTVMQWNM